MTQTTNSRIEQAFRAFERDITCILEELREEPDFRRVIDEAMALEQSTEPTAIKTEWFGSAYLATKTAQERCDTDGSVWFVCPGPAGIALAKHHVYEWLDAFQISKDGLRIVPAHPFGRLRSDATK